MADPAELTDTFVQTVPDKCDRIVWRGRYYTLPALTPQPEVAPDDEALICELSMSSRVYGRLYTHAALAKMEAAIEALHRHIAGLRDELMAAEHTAGAEQLRRETAEAALAACGHEANEWADAAANGVQWLKNVRDGISKPEDGIAEMTKNIARIRALKKEPTDG